MTSVTAQSVQRVLETYQADRSRYDAYLEKCDENYVNAFDFEEEGGDEAMSKILNLHWEQMCVAAKLEKRSNAEGVTQRCVEEYLSRSMAQKIVVESVMQCVCPKDPDVLIDKRQFLVVAFLISRVLQSAQEAALEDDSIWDDEEDRIDISDAVELKRKSLGRVEEEEDSWRIKSMPGGLASGFVAQSKQDEMITRNKEPDIFIPSEVETSGPLGEGLRSMSFANVSMSGINSSVNKPKEDVENPDPWSAFDVAANKSHSTNNSLRSISKLGDGYLSSRTLSLACARKKLQSPAVPGSTIKPLTEQEREKCLESFDCKGYKKRGGMPIREAIDMYHKIKGTNFVHFSKVWGLVDPETVCCIDERGYCALMALIQNIVDQGESVVLPKELKEEDISRLILDPSCQNQAQQAQTLKLDGLTTLLSRPESEVDSIDDLETPRTFVGSESECDWDDASSIGGASVISRIPSLIGSVKSMSFSLRNLVKNAIQNPRTDSTAKIPGLTSNMRASSLKIDTAAWKAQVGNGHQFLKVSITAAALGTRKALCNPHVCISFRDPIGRLIELPYEDLHPGIHHRLKGAVMFGNQSKIMKTAINRMPPGSSLFFEIKHWKASKKRMSTVAWSFVDADMIIDFGVISRVRQGKLALPLFTKPVDISRQRAKPLNSRHPCLYIQVEGLSSETES